MCACRSCYREDGGLDEWGPDAAYQAEPGGGLRVVISESLPGGLLQEKTARLYASSDWRHVEGGPHSFDRGTPMALAYRGAGATFPEVPAEQRRRRLRQVLVYISALLSLTIGAAAWTWIATNSGGDTAAVGIGVYAVAAVILWPITIVLDVRHRRRMDNMDEE